MNGEFRFLMYHSAEEDGQLMLSSRTRPSGLPKRPWRSYLAAPRTISPYLKNIFAGEELNKKAVTEKISATASDGKRYLTQSCNLDAIISVGYRVNSSRGTHLILAGRLNSCWKAAMGECCNKDTNISGQAK